MFSKCKFGISFSNLYPNFLGISPPSSKSEHVIENLSSGSKINYTHILDSLSQKNIYKNTAKHIINFKVQA